MKKGGDLTAIRPFPPNTGLLPKMTLCCEVTLVNQGEGQCRAVTLRCRSWSCENCYEFRKMQLIAEAASGNPERLITLTIKPDLYETPEEAARALSDGWRKLVRQIVSKGWCKKVEYFAVFEAHVSGWPHLHILQRGGYISWKWLRAHWLALTGAHGVDIRAIWDAKHCAGYVAKYIGKDPQRYQGTKRYWSTQGWDQSEWEKTEEEGQWSKFWDMRHRNIADLITDWKQTFPYVWWEAYTLYAGPEPPAWATGIERGTWKTENKQGLGRS